MILFVVLPKTMLGQFLANFEVIVLAMLMRWDS